MALFATGSLSDRVLDAWNDVPIEEPIDACSRNPFVNETMRQAGVQQRQQTIIRFYQHVNTFFDELLPQWRENGEDPDEKPNPPYSLKRYSRVDFVHTKIEKESEVLRLRTGRGLDHIEVEWPHPTPRAVQIIWQNRGPVICAHYDAKKQDLPSDLIRERLPQGEKTAGVDLGEVYLATAYDGEETIIINGGKLRELRDLQNQETAWFSSQIDTKEKGSNRFWKYVGAKKNRLKEIRNRINDYLHKMSTRLVEELWTRGVDTIVFGDITGIRDDMDYGADMNQRLHQWAFRQFIEKVEYKAERYGMTIRKQDEAFTSSTCPNCGARNKTSNRWFRCSNCGFEAHRDALGAVAIRALHLHDEDQDLELDRSRVLEAVRATANCGNSQKGSLSGRKTPQLGLFEKGASMPTRATLHLESPTVIRYEPHMDCVFDP